MASLPSIIDVFPAPNSLGIPLGDGVVVSFDQEMDEDSINSGTFVLVTPSRGVVFGAELNPFEEPGIDEDDLLSSPYYGAYVKGTISFSRVGNSGNPVLDSEVDYAGEGDLWNTVATFIPDQPLLPNVEYTVLVAGDEDPTNQFDSGVRTRTVFDAEPVSVTGDGTIEFSGGYTGDSNRTYVLEITSVGATGVATYEWWNSTDPLTVFEGVTTTGLRELENGFCVSFGHDGTFAIGDQWQVVCIPFLALENTYRWTFNTGSGSIVIPPSDYSASGIAELGSAVAVEVFAVTDITPASGEYGVDISTDLYVGENIVVEFTSGDTIDTDTLIGAIDVQSEPATGDDYDITYTGELDFDYSVVDGDLHIDLDPSQLYQNNIIIVTLDKDIANTNGTTLGSNYISYFSTTYTPLYSSLRKVQLDLGPILSDIPEESIMLAILEASIYAEAITFRVNVSNQKFFHHARREFVTCAAEEKLIGAILSGSAISDKMYKKLGDLSVSRGGGKSRMQDTLDRARECTDYWRIVVQSGGEISPDASVKPGYSVKGAWAADAIVVNRQWESISALGGNTTPAANTRVSESGSRRGKRTFRTRGWRGSE
jgi:hypothetical protein